MSRRSPSPTRKKVLVDTGGFYAFADASDRHHHEAVAIFSDLSRAGDYLFTTNCIVLETHALLLNRLHSQAALRFLKDTDEGSSIAVIWVTRQDEQEARKLIYRFEDKQFSLTDATSFVVMERLGISYVLTFDRHFSQYGLTLLTPEQ